MATIKSEEETTLLVLDRKSFNKIIKIHELNEFNK